MQFEFDEAKSQRNKKKHGIDFVEAQALWLDPKRVETPAREMDEPRARIVGRIQGKHWTAIVTDRGNRTRIISVRRSRKHEIARYEEKEG